MTKLRNIGYLRFGSKIRQGFAVATPSLTPTSLLFPSMDVVCCKCMWVRGPRLLYWGGACRPLPGGRGLHAIKQKF